MAGTIDRWRTFANDMQEQDLPRFGGRRVKLMGDGMLLEFESTVRAVECAFAIRERLAASEAPIDGASGSASRMGMHVIRRHHGRVRHLRRRGQPGGTAARSGRSGRNRRVCRRARPAHRWIGVAIEDLGERKLRGSTERSVPFARGQPEPVSRARPERRRRAGDQPAIAVLPFRGAHRELEPRVPRRHRRDDLIGECAAGEMFVVSRLSTAPFRDRLVEPRNIAEILGVRYVLSGTVAASGERVRVGAETDPHGDGTGHLGRPLRRQDSPRFSSCRIACRRRSQRV